MSEVECHLIQQDQFIALSYIYLDEMKASKQTSPHKFSILCKPYSRDELQYQLNILFEFTKTYPRTPIKYEFDPIVGITRDNVASMTKIIEQVIEENANKPMVFDIVEELRSWIEQYLVEGKAYRFEEMQQVKKQQRFQRPKFETFTPVTVQNFLAWKKQFEAKHKKLQKIEKEEPKITGKQWFLGKKPDQIEESQNEDEQSQEQQQQQVKIPEDENNDLFDP